MAVERVLDLDARDVLTARDDDVLGPVGDLDVAVGVGHREVAGVEPAAAEGLGGGPGIVEVALHHRAAAQHDLTHRGAVRRHRRECLRVRHHRTLDRVMAHALARH